MEHQGGGDPWHAIAQALGAEPHDLLFWEKVAKVVHAPRLPGYKSQDKPQPLLVGFPSPPMPPKGKAAITLPAMFCYVLLFFGVGELFFTSVFKRTTGAMFSSAGDQQQAN